MIMSKDYVSDEEELEEELLCGDIYDDEITDQDYGFILGPDGELKSVFMPLDYFEVPDKVKELLKMFGIDDPESVVIHTVH